jgi:hypothetical protein
MGMERAKKVTRAEREQFWRKRLAAWRASGLSQAAYCRQQRVSAVQFSWWKRQFKLRGNASSDGLADGGLAAPGTPLFVPVGVSAAASAVASFEVLLRTGQRVQVPPQFDPDALRRLLVVLEGARC